MILLIVGPVLKDVPISTFEAPISFKDLNNLKIQLGLSSGGLTLVQFLSMVGECKGCERIMWIRTKDYHCCLGKNAPPASAPLTKLFPRLDCTSGGQGISKIQYEYLFTLCIECGHVFLRTAQHSHFN